MTSKNEKALKSIKNDKESALNSNKDFFNKSENNLKS